MAADRRPAGGRLSRLRRQGFPADGTRVAMTGRTATYTVRPASEADLDRIAEFEIEIARISFDEDAILDPALHRKRVAAALGRPGEVTLVAVDGAAPDRAVGWVWLSGR